MKKRVSILIITLLLLGLMLTGCKTPSISESNLQAVELEDHQMLIGSESFDQLTDYCVTDSGIFALKSGRMKYYEFASEQSYVLCGRANCRHEDESCPAYYDWKTINSVVGLAMVGDARYVVKHNEKENTYDLLQSDLYGERQKVIYSIDIGDVQPGNWVVQEVSHVYYAKDMAWMTVSYAYVEDDGGYGFYDQDRVIGVRLSDSKELYRSELELNEGTYSVVLLSANYVILQKEWDTVPRVPEEDFYAAMEQGEYQEFRDSANPYADYYDAWSNEMQQPMYAFLLYDVDSGQTSVVDHGPIRTYYNENGEANGHGTGRFYMGQTYDGHILYHEFGPDFMLSDGGSVDVYCWDPQTGEEEPILHIPKGNLKFLNVQGALFISVTNDGKKFYYYITSEFEDGNLYTFYRYDLETGESTELFQTDLENEFNTRGETEDFFFGKNSARAGFDFYQISKEDYEKGNFDAAEKLNL